MHEIAHARELPLAEYLKSGSFEQSTPFSLVSENARAGATAPLQIVGPADESIPKGCRDVFVNDCLTALAQHTAQFAEHPADVLRMMQYVTHQHRVEGMSAYGKPGSAVTTIIDGRIGSVLQIDSDDICAKQRAEMMRNKAVPTTHIQNF